METRLESFDYDLAGLPYPVVLQNVAVQRCPSCGESAVSIPDPEGLHRRLGLDIIAAPRPLFPAELRFLRKLLDWTEAELALVLGVDAKTVSRWENGKQKMGTVSERLLRLVVRALEPHSPDWARETFAGLREGAVEAPGPVTLRPTDGGWRKAA
jgi:DNA-binding transcriptional regulator YiaG